MSDFIFRIVYCSRNLIAPTATQDEIETILAAARRNNASQNVTGALLYNKGCFAQVLEGPFEAVQDIFERIQADERHNDVVVLRSESVAERSFADWAMGYAGPDQATQCDVADVDPYSFNGQSAANEIVSLLDRVVRYQLKWATVPA